jgi:histidine triad (HIT) family protein
MRILLGSCFRKIIFASAPRIIFMKNCIFCQIVAGKIPCYKVYEDKDYLGFLDINVLNPGHSLIIPKKHFRWVWQVDKAGACWQAANKVANAQMRVLDDPITVLFLTSGFEVEHAHIHVLPRFKNDGHGGFVKAGNIKKISKEEMRKISQKIREEVA